MAKPIFLIGFPYKADLAAIANAQSDIMRLLGEEYHVLAYKTSLVQDTTFEVLNAVNASDVEIESLISKVREEMVNCLQKTEQDANS
jgi:hypothetical protein